MPVKSRFASLQNSLANRISKSPIPEIVATRMRGSFRRKRPLLDITPIQSPTLIVLMAGTSVEQYEQAGQLGRLSAALQKHTRYFRHVLLMSVDRRDYTERLDVDRVRHVRVPRGVPPFLKGAVSLIGSVMLQVRTVRKATSVVILDEESATSGWLASRLSSSSLSMSYGAPWAPPRHLEVTGKRRWLLRAALRRVEHVVRWPGAKSEVLIENAETTVLPELVDTDLFCPMTTTDPTRPRTVGVFLGTKDEADARVMLGVAEKLIRRKQDAVLRVFVNGHSAESRAAALQSEASERGLRIEFQAMPQIEMLPDAIARLRMCIAFDDSDSIEGLLRSMASGVPGIAVGEGQVGDGSKPADWSRFVLGSGSTEEEITRNIETLFREPGIRLRMAREGRRFVIAHHSLEALSGIESRKLLGSTPVDMMSIAPEPEFDADAEAEKLAQMLEGLGVTRSDAGRSGQQDVAA